MIIIVSIKVVFGVCVFSQNCAEGKFVNISCLPMIRIFCKQYFAISLLLFKYDNLKESIEQ